MVLWEVRGSELLVGSPDSMGPPDARSVADAWRSGALQTFGVRRVSNKVPMLRIEVCGRHVDELELRVLASYAGREAVVHAEQSNVLLDGVWHPIAAGVLVDCFEEVQRHNLSPGPISLGQYQLAVVAFAGSSAFEDRVDLDPTAEAERAIAGTSPARVDATLFDYQVSGSAFLRALASMGVGTLLADEMGLGKTLQVITLLAERATESPSLVVAPAALLRNWERELDRFTPHLRVLVHAGAFRTGVVRGLAGYDVVLTSYETLINDFVFMGDVDWDIVVLDEAQAIKNSGSRRAAAVKGLHRRVGVAVTGTPVENGLGDIWSIVEFVVPAIARRDATQSAGVERDLREAERVGRAVSPVMLRRKVSEVGSQLPDRFDTAVALAMSADERSRYMDLGRGGDDLAVLQALRMFCAAASNDMTNEDLDSSTKLAFLRSEIEKIAAHGAKALVFASFTKAIDRIVEVLAGLPRLGMVAAVDGRTTPDERQQLIDDFGRIETPAVLVMNPRAAGVGLNITAASYVIHFNPEWNPAATDQATARAHRTGQTEPVFVQYLYFDNSIEEQAMLRSDQKRLVAQHFDKAAATADEDAIN